MEAIGQLTGGLAHDFNNILAIIIGSLDLAAERVAGDPQTAELVEAALAAGLRGADLTRQLLAFARRQPLQPQVVSVNQVVESMTKLLARTLGEHIEIKLFLEADPWPVLVDPAQLSSAIANLATNARDAMPNGGTLAIATRNAGLDADYARENPDAAPGDYVLLEVSDTGSGMAPDVLARIFEPFFTTKRRDRGTGLGLSMVFGFVRQSGGHIKAYSEPGRGTTMRLYFPRCEDPCAPDRAATPDPEPLPAGCNETVLVVEDNPSVRQVVMGQLASLGYRTLEAENARAALGLLERGAKVDLVFSDLVMPGGMSGLELAAELRRRWPGLKTLLTSGFPGAMLAASKDAAAAQGLLTKPYRKLELARRVREILDRP
jgi:CheY-like chemotaxis protein